MIDIDCTNHSSPFLDNFIHLEDQQHTATITNGNRLIMRDLDIVLVYQLGESYSAVSLKEVWFTLDALHLCLH